MMLSMWIINDELSKQYETIPLIVDGKRTINSIRVIEDNQSEYDENIVYIGDASDYFFSYIKLGVILACGRDMLFVGHTDVLKIMNEVLLIFDRYRLFEDKLMSALSNIEDPFRDMLDVIHDLIKCPMLVGQKDLRIYALTEQYNDEDVYSGWNEMKKYYTMPLSLINATVGPDMQKYPDSIETIAIPVLPYEGKHFEYQIRSNIYRNKTLWGHLYIYYNNKSIPMSVIQLSRYCGDIYGKLVERLKEDNRIKTSAYSILSDILDGCSIEKEKTENILWQMNWNKEDKLRLYKIIFNKYENTVVFSDYAFMTLNSNAKEDIVFPYNNSIIVISKDNNRQLNDLLLKFVNIIPNDSYVCGVSYPFCDIELIQYAYYQADFAIQRMRKSDIARTNFIYYDDYALVGLMNYIKSNIKYSAFVLPSLIYMYELDKIKGTEYYKTLYFMLKNNWQGNKTAEQLYIHRNTLKYRMEKIKDVISVDIDDEEMRTYLRFCYEVMLDEYPLDINYCSDEY